MAHPNPLYVLILAGGSGERFWPLSRRARPKQLLSLFSKETLLEATLRRLDGLVPAEQILILTNADQEAGVRALCPQLPRENIVAEPAKRDTAAAIALGVGWIARRAPQATMVVLPADHLIQDTAGFQHTLRTAAAAAEQTGELDHRHPADVGVSGFRLHRAGRGVRVRGPRRGRAGRFRGHAFPRKAERGTRGDFPQAR